MDNSAGLRLRAPSRAHALAFVGAVHRVAELLGVRFMQCTAAGVVPVGGAAGGGDSDAGAGDAKDDSALPAWQLQQLEQQKHAHSSPGKPPVSFDEGPSGAVGVAGLGSTSATGEGRSSVLPSVLPYLEVQSLVDGQGSGTSRGRSSSSASSADNAINGTVPAHDLCSLFRSRILRVMLLCKLLPGD